MHARLPRDLQEVCQFQRQFAPATPIPAFGGTRGPEVAKSISDIQASMRGALIILGRRPAAVSSTMQPMQAGFGKLVARLQSVDYNILDVRNMAWYDDFSAFRSGVRSLEVRLSNVMQLAVDSAGSLSARVELLEARQTPFVLFSPGLPMQNRAQDSYLTCRPDGMCVCVCVCVNLLAVPARVPIEAVRLCPSRGHGLQLATWQCTSRKSPVHVLWQALRTMSYSPGVCQTLARLTSALATAFQSELAEVKKAFDVARRTASASAVADLKSAGGSAGTARYACQAAATLQLVRRIEASWSAFQVAAHMHPAGQCGV